MARVAFIGAGSVVFTKNLLGDMLSFPELRGVEIALHDIDPDRLATAEAMARYVAREREASPAISRHVERRAALDGADYVINMVQVGGHAATLLDFEIPARHGLRQTIARHARDRRDLPRAPHDADHMLALGRDMAELCPAPGCSTTRTRWRCCAGSSTASPRHRTSSGSATRSSSRPRTSRELVGVPVDEVTFLAAGVNHQAFILRFEREGEDLYPLLDARDRGGSRAPAPRARPALPAVRLLPDRVERASAEYVPWFMRARRRDRAATASRSTSTSAAARRTSSSTSDVQGGCSSAGKRMPLAQVERVRGVDHPLDGDRDAVRSSTATCATRGSSRACPTTAASRCRASSTRTGVQPDADRRDCPPSRRAQPDLLNVVELTVRAALEGATASTSVTPRCSTRTPRRRSRSTDRRRSATS